MMNKYDHVVLDINRLLQHQATSHNVWRPAARSADRLTVVGRCEAALARLMIGGLYRSGILRRLIYANLKLDWFFEFREYWIRGLGLRRLELPDFYYLRGVYRQKFQALEVSDHANTVEFLRTWQDPAALYLLFHYQYKLALHPLAAYTLAQYIPRGATICEFGCGIAPITQCLATYYPGKDINITAADIPSYMLHFAGWKFRHTPFARVLAINPADDAPLTDAYDVITCMTVLEHLPRPLALVRHLHDQLVPGGTFMFDYILSEGSGLDTEGARRQRREVLDYIRAHFSIVRGSIPETGSATAVICRKNKKV